MKKMENLFLKNVMEAQSNKSYTENGAVSYKTSGSVLVDQFGRAGSASGRDILTVFSEQEALWSENPEMALRFPFYLRMITRKVILDSDNVTGLQKGPGARDEAFKRLLWIEKNHPEEFYRNLWLLPVVGSFKDYWTLLVMDDKQDVNKYFDIMSKWLEIDSARDLVIKYMPRIRSNSKCKTETSMKLNELAKKFSRFLGMKDYEEYRKLKTSGKAHVFQQVITAGEYDHINWNAIPGIAIQKLSSGKFLPNHHLEEAYLEWIQSQPSIKFNGTPVDLLVGSRSNRNVFSEYTANKQFDGLIEKARNEIGWKENVLCGLDTSGSMGWCNVAGRSNIRPIDVSLSLGIYFSELNTGQFHNYVAMFDSHSTMMKLEGTFSEKVRQIGRTCAMGSTNFQSLINLICDIRRDHPEIPLEDFPTTLLVVSDMQFNNSGSRTNLDASREKLKKHFPEDWVDNFKFIWWNCVERDQNDVPATLDKGNNFMLSGYDGSIITLLTGLEEKKKAEKQEGPTMEELVDEALNQEVLLLIR